MFGFSLQKLLFTIAVVVIVWYGFKLVGRIDKKRRAQLKGARKRRPAPSSAPGAEDMVKCATCGTYIAANGTRSCGRSDCPYPG
jgi:hypothetical protein